MANPREQTSCKIESYFEAVKGPIEPEILDTVQRSCRRNVFDLGQQCLAIEKETRRLNIVDAVRQKPAGAFEKAIDGNVRREFIPGAKHAVKPVPVSGHLCDKTDASPDSSEIVLECHVGVWDTQLEFRQKVLAQQICKQIKKRGGRLLQMRCRALNEIPMIGYL